MTRDWAMFGSAPTAFFHHERMFAQGIGAAALPQFTSVGTMPLA